MSKIPRISIGEYLCKKTHTYETIDLPVDYVFAEQISLIRQVEFFLKNTTERKLKLELEVESLVAINRNSERFIELFPAFSEVMFQFPFLLDRLDRQENIDYKSSFATVNKISESEEYKKFFSSYHLLESKRKQDFITTKIPSNSVFFHEDDPNYVQFAINPIIIKNKVIYGSSSYLCDILAQFLVDDFQKIFYNSAIIKPYAMTALILTDDLILADINHQFYSEELGIRDIAWISWFSRKPLDVPTSLPWQKLTCNNIFWLFHPHSNQSFEESLQVLSKVEKQLENNGIPAAQLNIISFWGAEQNRENFPLIMTNNEFHCRYANNRLFLAKKQLPVSKTDVWLAKINDGAALPPIIFGEYHNWWQSRSNSCRSQLSIIDFTGNISRYLVNNIVKYDYYDVSTQVDCLNIILNLRENPSMVIIIIGGIPSTKEKLEILAAQLSRVFLNRVVIIFNEASIKPILSINRIKVTKVDYSGRYILKVERWSSNTSCKKYYIENKDGKCHFLSKFGYKRQHFSKSERKKLSEDIESLSSVLTIKKIAQKLKITESLVKKIRRELTSAKQQIENVRKIDSSLF